MAKDKITNANANQTTSSIIKNLEAGGMAASTELVTYPWSTLAKKKESGLFDVTKQIQKIKAPSSTSLKPAFLTGCYKGFKVNIAKTFVQVPYRFVAQQQFKDYYGKLKNKDGNSLLPSSAVSFLSGASAGLTETVGLYPADNVITKLQTGNASTAKQIFQQGRGSLYNGVELAMARSVGGLGMTFAAYDSIMPLISDDPKNPKSWQTFVGSSFGGVCGQLFTNPLDVVRTRVVIQKPASGETIKSGLQIAKDIYAKEGWIGFWRGGGFNSIKTVSKFGPRATMFAAAPKIIEKVSEYASIASDKLGMMFKDSQQKQNNIPEPGSKKSPSL